MLNVLKNILAGFLYILIHINVEGEQFLQYSTDSPLCFLPAGVTTPWRKFYFRRKSTDEMTRVTLSPTHKSGCLGIPTTQH